MSKLKLKNSIYVLFFLFLNLRLYSQNMGEFEVLIEVREHSGNEVVARVSPVGAIFNGDGDLSTLPFQGKYKLDAAHTNPDYIGINKIYGGISPNLVVNNKLWINHDHGGLGYDTFRPQVMLIGWGKYKVEFGYFDVINSNEWIPLEGDTYCYMDFSDGIYGPTRSDPISTEFTVDIAIYLNYSSERKHYITFNFVKGYSQELEITDSRLENRTIKLWHQIGTHHSILGNDPYYPGSPHKGVFYSDNNGSNTDFPIIAPISINNKPFVHDLPGNFNNAILNVVYNSISKIQNNLNFVNSDFTIKNNISFEIQQNSNLIFNNLTSSFRSFQGSIINFPHNYLLSVSNGGYINSNGSIFNSSSSWNGIKLENSGSDTIINCTFNNAKTAVSIANDNLINNPNIIIRKNTFNISQDNGRGIDARNLNKILIDSNIFNISNSNSTIGIYFRNSNSSSEGQRYFSYNLNIVNNKFYNGYLPVYISGLTSARTPFYVYNNTFYGTNTYSIAGLKITGDIKNNRFDVNNNTRSVGLWNSNPNIFGNSFNSVSTNMYLNYSFPSIAPYPNSTDQLIWIAWRNSFNSVQKENIYLEGSYPYLENGSNIFTVSDTLHIIGNMPDSVNEYRMSFNCWYGRDEIPGYFLYKYINDSTMQYISADYTPTFCEEQPSTFSEVYTDKGSEIIDTTLITDDFDSDPPSVDESLLGQARISNGIKDFPGAIINYKGLINNYAGSELICTSLYEMYDNYSALDTSGDQNVTDVLFGDLKQYLQGRINTSNYTEDFERQAFDVILMCETNMKNYEVALTGYEFIALYHPNAEQRMLASWDYDEIEEMINGSGGGEKQLGIRNDELGIEELEINELNRLDKLIDDDPLMKTLKKNYEKKYAFEKNIKSDKLTENKLIQRAKENIFKVKFLQKEEKEKRYMEDLKLLMTTGNTDAKEIENTISKPKEFILNQNYPNPFNPVTNIGYSVPVSSFVNLKVFDITGKEIVTLVNEYKQNGSYQVTFNGINLSSGIYYFYISAGEFSQVKKMMLIK